MSVTRSVQQQAQDFLYCDRKKTKYPCPNSTAIANHFRQSLSSITIVNHLSPITTVNDLKKKTT
ncbi:MAG: hypothetical protein LAT56_17600, partial [Wenzhouxiangella sp.]|nr:hypothetical protein [Wenzhouxiangella sp.]